MAIPSLALVALGTITTYWVVPHAWYHAIYRYGRLTFGWTAERVGCCSLAMRTTALSGMAGYLVWRDGPTRLIAWGQWSTSWAPYAGVLLIAGGQFVNASVYRALGLCGVYYGREIGTETGAVLKRVSSFPYNLGIQHPLYLSNIATVIGLGLLYGYGAIAWEVWAVAGVSTGSYLFSMWSESGRSFTELKAS